MNQTYVGKIIATLLVVAGLFLPTAWWIWIVQGADVPDDPQLVLGVQLFRAGLVVLGGYIQVLGFAPKTPEPCGLKPEIATARPIETAVFSGLIICATFLRLYNLNTGIWFDEMLTSVNYMPLTVGQIVSTYHDANNHVLFSVLARSSLNIFGDSVWALRLPAVCFGLGSIVALYYFARRVVSARESLFAVALMAFSYHHIWFSQNARGYTALLFFSILSSAWLLDALRQGSRRKWVLYAVAVGLGGYTHLTMALVVIAHLVIWAVTLFRAQPHRWRGLFYGFIPAGLLTFQAYALVIPSMVSGALLNSGLQGPDTEWTNPLWALMEIVNGLQVGFAGAGVGLVAVAVFVVGLWGFLRHRPEVATLFLIPVVFGFLAMTSIGYTLFPRFFFFAMGFGVVIVVHGAMLSGQYLSLLFRLSEPWPQRVSALFCAAIVAVMLPSLRHVHLPKQNFAGAISLIERERQDGDRIVTIGIAGFPFNAYYGKDWPNVKSIAELEGLEAAPGRTWLVYTMPVHARTAYPDIMARIARDYTEVRSFGGTLNGGAVVINLENPAPAS